MLLPQRLLQRPSADGYIPSLAASSPVDTLVGAFRWTHRANELEHVYVNSEIELEPCDIRHMLMVLSHASPTIFWSQPPRVQSEGLEDVEATNAMIQRVLLEEELGGSGSQSGGKRM